jgi:hypothetical protein
MTTVPGSDTPMPADNHKITLLQSDENLYVRPTAGTNAASAGSSLGPGPTAADAPAGLVPGYAINWSGAAASTGGTQVGNDVGSGATIIAGQPDATGHPAGDANGGTVGDSGPQGAGPGPTPNSPSGMPDLDNDGDSL